MSIGARRMSRHHPHNQPSGANILTGKIFTSDIVDSINEPGHSTSLLTDQNTTTRWISQPASPVNITVDMEAIYDLSAVVIVFAADTIQNYTVSISSNGSSWSTIASGTTNNTLSQTITHSNLSGATQGRYLRITGLDRWNAAWGNSIWEVEAYGTFVQAVPVGTITNFTTTVASDTQVNLSWTYSGSALSNYTLTRNGVTIANPAAGATSYSNTGLTAGTAYTYTLVANLQAGGTSNTTSSSATTTGGVTGTWLSGASCVGAGDNGGFGSWRGTPLASGTTWSDTSWETMTALWQFDSGQQFYNFTGTIDLAPGAIYSGMTWGQAASGSADAYWTQFWNTLKTKWNRIPRQGDICVRFAHELNGNWYPWSVNAANVNNFKTAWIRFYNIKQSIFPQAKLVFGTNGNTVGQTYDWRTLWPGDQYVDIYSTDWYAGHYKNAIVNGQAYDGYGGPVGLIQHREFALAHGKPIVISEWGVDHTYGTGDDPNYIQYIYDFCSTHGGTGAGNLLYENYFNLSSGYSNDFQLYYPGQGDSSSNPNSAARYRQLF